MTHKALPEISLISFAFSLIFSSRFFELSSNLKDNILGAKFFLFKAMPFQTTNNVAAREITSTSGIVDTLLAPVQ